MPLLPTPSTALSSISTALRNNMRIPSIIQPYLIIWILDVPIACFFGAYATEPLHADMIICAGMISVFTLIYLWCRIFPRRGGASREALVCGCDFERVYDHLASGQLQYEPDEAAEREFYSRRESGDDGVYDADTGLVMDDGEISLNVSSPTSSEASAIIIVESQRAIGAAPGTGTPTLGCRCQPRDLKGRFVKRGGRGVGG